MASGPIIPSIADGDALLGSVIRTALKNLQDFVSSIPVDNLERYNCRWETSFSSGGTVAVNKLRHFGYQKIQVGAATSSASTTYSVNIYLRLAGVIAAGDSFTFTIEESSTVNGTYTTVTGCTHEITNAGATHTAVVGDDATSFGYYTQLAPTAAIAAGQFIRLKVANAAGSTQVISEFNVTLGLATQLQ